MGVEKGDTANRGLDATHLSQHTKHIRSSSAQTAMRAGVRHSGACSVQAAGSAHYTVPQTMHVSPVVIDYTYVHIAFPSTVTFDQSPIARKEKSVE
ncbi:hypothetical protein E2C01_047346 [Portunus trituberculatus]|uniref:Uncharacterized protein n=1 Tax=Portunus trituberculatus TaxID=210409 RepID=A0A5B7GA86_PORTR|nr:hypothetical protein [Portunus trituberculatus]